MTESIYVSLDIETNGSYPIENSMLSIGAVAFDFRGELGFFYKKIAAVPGSKPDPETMDEFWSRFPNQWEEVNKDPEPPEKVFNEYLQWITALANGRAIVHCATPAAWDGFWIYYYLMRFAGASPSKHRCLDIRTLAMIVTGREYHDAHPHIAAQYLGVKPGAGEDHIAVNDAREQGRQMMAMLRDIRRMKQTAENAADWGLSA